MAHIQQLQTQSLIGSCVGSLLLHYTISNYGNKWAFEHYIYKLYRF